MAGGQPKVGKKNHFIVFVCFLSKIQELSIVPEVYVMPSERVAKFTYTSATGTQHSVAQSA